jgi:hypothetical protein
METILTKKECGEQCQQITDNSELINFLSESVAKQLSHHVENIIRSIQKEYPRCFSELSLYNDNISLLLDLRNYIEKFQTKTEPEKQESGNKKKRGIDAFPRHYAIFHRAFELYGNEAAKKIPIGNKKEVIKIAEELYPADGTQFYNQYRVIFKTVTSILFYIKKMKLEDRNILNKIAHKFGTQKFIEEWWNINLPERV